ncbi:Hypp8457 [Branchiostoma lanceolatum]|uniref:Hypp8457 protein n=1 Tax=Branchiostoma lanceolatum TaxID=7740 RepID=A0A8J9Z815_BRALA|nr:Hypp8457 [Branchiostoma lanceolatum]
MKSILDKMQQTESCHIKQEQTPKRLPSREQRSPSTKYERICIFCNKGSKYVKGTNSREALIQCCDMRADTTIRTIATERNDSKILAVVTRELVAAEAYYHRSCYKSYTRASYNLTSQESADDEYTRLEADAYQQLYQYIRSDVIEEERVVRLSDITGLLVENLTSLGIKECKPSTKKHIRRHLEAEFGEMLKFETLLDNTPGVFLIPANLTPMKIAKNLLTVMAEDDGPSKKLANIQQAAINIRYAIWGKQSTMSWPPHPAELEDSALDIPHELGVFLCTLLTGGKVLSVDECNARVKRLMKSYAQDLMFGATRGQIKPPKHVLLPYAVKTLTNNVELVSMLNRCGHGISYSQLEEINTALCLQKMEQNSEIPLPDNIQPYVSTTLAWDNIDRLEETLSGEGTSHRVNGIAVQARHFGPPVYSEQSPGIPKSKRRSVEPLAVVNLPIYNSGERQGPKTRGYVDVTCQVALENARRRDLLWILVRLHGETRQKVSGWTGYNISVRNETEIIQDTIGYLPTIDAPATNMSTVHEILVRSLKIKDALHLKSIVLVFDQALYAKATEIIWKHPHTFKDIVPRMGMFHTLLTMLSIIGKRFQDAGLRDICIESGVIAEGSVTGVLEGRKYNRAIRFHKLMYEALQRLVWKDFLEWIGQSRVKKEFVKDFFVSLKPLYNDVCQEEQRKVLTSQRFSEFVRLYDEHRDFLRNSKGKLARFWMSYIEMVEIMLNLVGASREGDWELHLSAISQMIPWCFAYDHTNYARYLPAYLFDMSHLNETHPEAFDYLKSGGFSVQIGDQNPFGRIPVDQTCEETVNKDTQTSGGTKGFSLKPGAISKYYLVAEYRSMFLKKLRDMFDVQKAHSDHTDLQNSRITRDEADVMALDIMLERHWINPFSSEHQDLVCLSTGKLATPKIEEDLLNAKAVGEKAYEAFRVQRLEKDSQQIQFHDTMKKSKLKTFSELNKKVKVRDKTAKEIILKADMALFGQMIIIAESRKLHLRDVLCHPLGPLPWSLATTDGSLRKTVKSTLAKELQKNVPAADNIPHPSACIVDGMALVQRLKADQKTFSEVADSLLNMILHEGSHSSRIDVVFDVYQENSIKSVERERRGSECGTEFRHIQPEHKVLQWKKFVLNPKNKTSLTRFLTNEWKQDKYRRKLKDKVLFIACDEGCHKISTERTHVVRDLNSNQEEADTRIMLHVAHAARSGYETVIVSSEDTDVFLLCLAFEHTLPTSIFFKCGTQTRIRYVSISSAARVIGQDLCSSLLGMHAFTGCDTVSAFSGRGKLGALRLVKQNRDFQEMFKLVGTEWELSDELFKKLQNFTCHMYTSRPGTSDVNEIRYRLFCAKRGSIDSIQLPPCADCLYKHAQRANYVAAVWKRSLECRPVIPSPIGFGWCQDGAKLAVDWMDGDPAPSAVLELLSCSCSKACKLPKCSCLKNGLKCTDMCKLPDCDNRPNDSQDATEDSDDDEDE